MTMTDAELAEIRARVEAATPGPWEAGEAVEYTSGPRAFRYEGAYIWQHTPENPHAIEVVVGGQQDEQGGAVGILGNEDATFIAHARTDIPALLDELAEARKENERLRDAVKAVVNLTELCSAFCHVARAKQVLSWYPAALHSATEDADDRTT